MKALKDSAEAFANLNHYNPMLLYVATLLSTCIIISCIYLKVPQILYIRRSGNANGVYLQAVLMEITGYTIVTLYNFTNGYSFMTYLEYPIILIQLYILTMCILKCRDLLYHPVNICCTIIYIFVVLAFTTGLMSKAILLYLVPLSTPISGFSKVTYIYGIIKEQNADSVSLVTWIISIATNAGRIFTVFMDSADMKLLINLTISSLLSLCVLLTAFYYQTRNRREPLLDEDHEHVD